MSKKIINMFEAEEDNSKKPELRIFNNFAAPFVKNFSKEYGIEAVANICIAAWNLAGMREFMPKAIHDGLIEFEDFPESDRKLARKIFDKKLADFADFDFIIKDVEMDDSQAANGRIISQLTAQSVESVMSELMDDDAFENEDRMEDAMEMMGAITQSGYIDRIAIIARPTQVFWDCYLTQTPNDSKTNINKSSAYLIDEETDPEQWLKSKYIFLLHSVLAEWDLQKKLWPKKPTYKTFEEWIDIEITTMVYDMESAPVQKEGLPY